MIALALILIAVLAVDQLVLWRRLRSIRIYDGPPNKELLDAVAALHEALAKQAAAIAVIKANRAEGPS